RRLRVYAPGGEQVLDAERLAFERRAIVGGELPVGCLLLLQRLLPGHRHLGVELGVRRLDRIEIRPGQFGGRKILALQPVAGGSKGEAGEIGQGKLAVKTREFVPPFLKGCYDYRNLCDRQRVEALLEERRPLA